MSAPKIAPLKPEETKYGRSALKGRPRMRKPNAMNAVNDSDGDDGYKVKKPTGNAMRG